MLSLQADAVTAEPDGRSAPEVSLDARVRRCRVGTTGNRGQFSRHTGLMVPFEDGHQGYSTPKKHPWELSIWGMPAPTGLRCW
jgi:hypothetical protein